MSSHHIIRDEQEPALILIDLKPANCPIVWQLLEWSPTVVALEPSIENITSLGHKVDVAVVSGTKVSFWKEQLSGQIPILVLGADKGQEIDLAFQTLLAGKNTSVNLVVSKIALGSVLKLVLPWQKSFEIVVYTEREKHVISKNQVFRKWLPKNSELRVSALLSGMKACTTGFIENLTDIEVSEGMVLRANQTGETTIRSNVVPFLVSERMN